MRPFPRRVEGHRVGTALARGSRNCTGRRASRRTHNLAAIDPSRPDPPVDADERTTLEAFLDYQRATLVWKVTGVTDEDARRPWLPGSRTTLAGLVKHLIDVEGSWFREMMARQEVDWPWDPDDPEAVWRVGPDESLADLVAAYEKQCERSRQAVAGVALEDVGRNVWRGETLRWVLVHMIEETARHNGHADLLRERIDGVTGE